MVSWDGKHWQWLNTMSLLPPAYVVRREGNVLTRICPSINLSVHRGVPISHSALQHFPESHGADTGGRYPARSSWGGWYPAGVGGTLPGGTLLGGSLLGGGGTLPGGTLPGGYPVGGTLPGVPCWGVPCGGYPAGGYPGRVPPPARSGWGGYPVRTTEGVVTTRRAVCLLRSRRRTFLFCNISRTADY